MCNGDWESLYLVLSPRTANRFESKCKSRLAFFFFFSFNQHEGKKCIVDVDAACNSKLSINIRLCINVSIADDNETFSLFRLGR